MSSNDFLKVAKNVARKDKAVFEALMEFEKTHKIRTKERVNFTIDKNIISQFRKFCRNKGYNMSAKIEQAIRDVMKKEKYAP